MKLSNPVFPVLVMLVITCSFYVFCRQSGSELKLVSVTRIWDKAPHNAFTDLIRIDGTFYCTVREGTGHVPGETGADGTIRVIASQDAKNWSPVALLAKDGVDLRDPKLSYTPDGRLLLLCGGSTYNGDSLLHRQPYVAFSDTDSIRFESLIPMHIDDRISTPMDWLWRITWHKGTAYGVVYQPLRDTGWKIFLVKSTDAVSYDLVTELAIDGNPNESTIRFLGSDTMAVLVRRESGNRHAMFGTSTPPYQNWTWTELPLALGGPNFIPVPDGRLLAAGRSYEPEVRTMIGRLFRDGAFEEWLCLPSGGDTSYPGLVLENHTLWMSYYSSHEEKTAIYLAKFEM